ncbi:MAG: hypothetical protein FJ267_14820, partial [Planctomycetes bacterium]|nr:hypothetical protein [Planctomycetota bacterium]
MSFGSEGVEQNTNEKNTNEPKPRVRRVDESSESLPKIVPGKSDLPNSEERDSEEGKREESETNEKDVSSAKVAEELLSQMKDATDRERLILMFKLRKMGEKAVEPVATEAERGHEKTMKPCFDVLGMLLSSNDEKTISAAKAALEKLAKSQKPAVALRAKTVKGIPQVFRRGGLGGPIPRAPAGSIEGGLDPDAINSAQRNSEKRTIRADIGNRKLEIIDFDRREIQVK